MGWVTLSLMRLGIRYRPRFSDQVGHQNMSAYIENKLIFTKSCHCQTNQNYEQPPPSCTSKVIFWH